MYLKENTIVPGIVTYCFLGDKLTPNIRHLKILSSGKRENIFRNVTGFGVTVYFKESPVRPEKLLFNSLLEHS